MSIPAMADETQCGILRNAFGPFDYRTAKPSDLQIVEDYHFTRDVETLRHGISGTLAGELDYTLRAFPNHHRALASIMNLQFKLKSDHPYGARWAIPCYFDRALRFSPDDAAVHTIFAVYLLRLDKAREAIGEFQNALSLGDDSGNLHYNLGLAYFNLKEYDKAAEEAKKAYERGFTLPGLKDKLRKISKWPSD
jgi:tetratricopeptide (TPR) repeat protein